MLLAEVFGREDLVSAAGKLPPEILVLGTAVVVAIS
jgi:hypothetical protein